MANKYQEALNYISTFLSQVRGRGNGKSNQFIKLAESLITLQELINSQSFMKLELNDNQKLINKLIKALDKACEKLFFVRAFDGMTPRNIKEHLLKESEKE